MNIYSEINPYVQSLADISDARHGIKQEMYAENDVKRGLRDINGKGVVAGLTEVSAVIQHKTLPNGETVACDGELRYRGINVRDLVNGFISENRFGFEETVYLCFLFASEQR